MSQKSDVALPWHAELVFVPRTEQPETTRTQYPGVYIFSDSSRLIRPVMNCLHQREEWIGTYEQVRLQLLMKIRYVNLQV